MAAPGVAECFSIKARADAKWYFYAKVGDSTYRTFDDGAELIICFDKARTGPYTVGYGKSDFGAVTLEVLPFNPR